MNVLIISPGQDTGGQGIRIKQAFDKHAPDWHVRSMHAKDNYIRYPSDLLWSLELGRKMYDWADVVHHKTRLDAYALLENGHHKPTLIHHQGTRLRDHAKIVNRESASIGAVPLVSTLDLLLCTPKNTAWLPSPYDIEWLQRYRQPNRTRSFRICHAPTNRRVKGTDVILAAIEQVSRQYDVTFDLVEGVEWKVVLSRKGRCDLFIDQLTLGCGNNAIEAWAMGIPVIAGVEDQRVLRIMKKMWGNDLPFYEATPTNIETKIIDMIRDRDLAAEYGARGLRHALQYHDEKQVVELLKGIWSTTPPSLGLDHFKQAKTEIPAKRLK